MKLKYHTMNDLGYLQGTLLFLLKILGLLILSMHLVSCASLYVLPDTERAAVTVGEKTIILLRIQCTIDNQPHESFITPTFTAEPIIALGIGTFDTIGEPKPAVHRFLSEESRRAGWTYFVLSPGVYYLAVLGPDSSVTSKTGVDYLREAPRWRVDIPENTRLLYIGTLELTGKTAGTLIFGGKIIVPVNGDELTLKNEHELASSLLAQHFPEIGEPKTILMQRWHRGEPIIIRSPKSSSRK